MKRTGILSGAGLTFGLVVALQSGCAGTAPVKQPAATPEVVPQGAVKPAAASDIEILSGKVVETMSVGGYTYVNLEKDGHKSWAAIPLTKVEVGQEIEVRPGTQMGKFTSKSLNRTFDSIVFSSGLVMDTKATTPANSSPADEKTPFPQGHPPMDAKQPIGQGLSAPDAKAQPKGHMGGMEQAVSGFTAVSGKVVETMDSGGYTYIRIENAGKNVWAAVPTMKVSVGQELKLQPGQEMFNFKSKSLNRTFDSVIFSGGEISATK